MRTAIAFATLAALTACDPPPVHEDATSGELDAAPPPRDASVCEEPIEGCACGERGRVHCVGGFGYECCRGVWSLFVDGACAPPPDGSVPMCGAEPEAGCPCDEEGAIGCPSYRWQVICQGGTWVAQEGRICC